MGVLPTDPGQKPEPEKKDPPAAPPTPAPAAQPEKKDELVELIKADPIKTAEEIRALRKEAADNRHKAQKAEDDAKATEEKKLKEQGEYKELAEKREKELADLRAAQKQDRINSAVALEAAKAGIADPADAIKLADFSKVAVDDAGVVSGVAEAIADLVKAKPYLVKANPQAQPKVGATNPGGGPVLTAADLKKMSQAEIYNMDPDAVAAALARK